MNKRRKKITWITYTALFLAITIIAQYLGMNIGNPLLKQLFTGSMVNMSLIVSGVIVGASSGIVIAVLSPIMAFMLGIAPALPAVPVIAAGSTVLVILTSFLYHHYEHGNKAMINKKAMQFISIIISAAAKCAVMWGLALVILPIFISSEAQVEKMVGTLSIPQFFTATLGGIVSMLVIPALQQATSKSRS